MNEYKTRERIHPSLADLGLLVIPASRGRLQTSIRTGGGFIRIGSTLRYCNLLYHPLYYACSPRYQRDMLIWRHPHLPPREMGSKSKYDSSTFHGAVSADTCNSQRGLRSLPHLREQFKPRTDDGHASPVHLSCEGSSFLELSSRFLTLVRFFVYHRIKPHNPLLVQVPVYSFEF